MIWCNSGEACNKSVSPLSQTDNEDKWMDEMGFVAQIDICWLICYLQVQLLTCFGKASAVVLLFRIMWRAINQILLPSECCSLERPKVQYGTASRHGMPTIHSYWTCNWKALTTSDWLLSCIFLEYRLSWKNGTDAQWVNSKKCKSCMQRVKHPKPKCVLYNRLIN